ncbi:MAG: winged helix-turn-helix domain-containing protein, partial [Acidobacteriota bacterium]|nr:winged helix-turn-helix domain-containing protein [Acidobacteriota bacterium]
MSAYSQFKFGPFVLNPGKHLLTCRAHEVHLPPKSFLLLELFAGSKGRLLTKKELIDSIWPEVFVEENNLNIVVHELREMFKKYSPGVEYIKTVRKLGYRFLIEVEEVVTEGSEPALKREPFATIIQASPRYDLRFGLFQLPAPVADFLGRETEIADLVKALQGKGGRVGINGMPGVGKTQLALFIGNKLINDYPDAQLFIELRGSSRSPRPPEEALSECIRAFVHPEYKLPEGVKELNRLYRILLKGLSALVVLDDASDGAQVELLLPPADCAVIITSRDALILPGLHPQRLLQLQASKSRELFMSIVPRVEPAIAERISALCGHLPLAIRAAASLLAVTEDLDPLEYAKNL